MTNIKIKYTYLRNNIYWFHFKLTAAIYKTTALSSPLIRHTLNTHDPEKARTLAQLLAFKIKEICSHKESHLLTSDFIKQFINNMLSLTGDNPKTKPVATKPEDKTRTINDAFESFKVESNRANRWRAQTEYDNCISNRVFIELVGNISITEITSAICRNYRDLLLKYPVQRNKEQNYKGKSILDIINSKMEYQSISLTTVNNHLRRTSCFLNWLLDQGYKVQNPLARMKIRQTHNRKSSRSPFNDDDLKMLYSSCIFSQHNYSQDYQFWVPLLGLYTGARLEEICQLHIDDINLTDDVPHICIDDKFDGQAIKSQSSRRQIPIHSELFDLGFREFVQQKINSNQSMLFGYLIPQRDKFGHQPSKWFGRYKTKLGITDNKKVFHSFRHTMVERLRQKRINDYEIKAILGHSSGSITHDIYGSDRTPLNSIQEALQELSYQAFINQIRPWITTKPIN